MSYLAVDLAVFERLVGAPIDGQGNPVLDGKGVPINRLLVAPPLSGLGRLPSYGVRIPMLAKGRDTDNLFSSKNARSIRLNDFSRTSFMRIPVFPENTTGRDFDDIWPAVTFYWLDEQFNPDTYLYADPVRLPDPTSPEASVRMPDGSIKKGPYRTKRLTHPDPYDLTYAIRVWSKDFVEYRQICEAVKRLFPARGVLEVERADGTKAPYDMLLDSIDNYDLGKQDVAMLGLEADQRSYSRAFLYKIESYVDNTIDSQSMWVEETIRTRILDLVDKQMLDKAVSTTEFGTLQQ